MTGVLTLSGTPSVGDTTYRVQGENVVELSTVTSFTPGHDGKYIPSTITAEYEWEGQKDTYVYKRYINGDKEYNGEQYYCWAHQGFYLWTKSETPNVGDTLYLYQSRKMVVDEDDSLTNFTIGIDAEVGHGVIYRLIDEFNNDIKYDFKNIQFKRKLTDGQYDATNGTDTWCYTLNLWYQDMCQDASIVGNTLPNDEGFIDGVYDNKFGYATAYDLFINGVGTFAFALGDNVVLSFDNGEYYGIYSNTIGNSFCNNTIGNFFYNNTIGNYIGHNTIGNNFNFNTISNDFRFNTIGNDSSSNTISNNFRSNTIGDQLVNNTIGDNLYHNTIGDYFYSNTIGNNFSYNTIGNNFNYNTIGNNFDSNTIGTRNGNTITTIDNVRYIRVEDGIQFVDITTSATTSDSNWLQNITIAQGVRGTSASTRKVITHPTVNDNFQTIYRSINSQVVTV